MLANINSQMDQSSILLAARNLATMLRVLHLLALFYALLIVHTWYIIACRIAGFSINF